MPKKFGCSFCHYVSTHCSKTLNHIWDFHSCESNFSVVCGVSGCSKQYSNKKSYKRHIKNSHSLYYEENLVKQGVTNLNTDGELFCDTSTNELNLGMSDDDADDDCENDDDGRYSDENNLVNYDELICHILLELREIYNVTNVATCYLSAKFKSIIEKDRATHSSHIKHSLNRNNPNFTLDYETDAVINCRSQFCDALEKFSGEKALDNYVKSKKEYIEPVAIQVGFDPLRGTQNTIQYVPILKTLDVVLHHEDVLGEILCNDEIAESGHLKSYCDGLNYYSNELFASEKLTLELVLYHDDFNIVNPLGNKTVKYKISAFYFVVGNIPARYRSRLKDINLIILSPASYISEYGYQTILAPVIDDIKKLEENGLQIKFEGAAYLFFGTISMFIADNLAAHALGGYYCNFSTVQRFCRFCNCLKSQLDEGIVSSQNFVARSKEAYDAQVTAVELDSNVSSLYGIKSRSCLNCLSFFHCVNGLPPDLAHDLFEGFAVDVVSNVVVYCIRQSFFTLTQLNDAIISFKYSFSDQANKPQPIKERPLSKLKVKQTAVEMWNLLRLLPFIIGHLVPFGDVVWDMYSSFLDCVDRLSAQSYTNEDLIILDECITQFFTVYCDVFPDQTLRPKAHFLTHYPELIKQYGPLTKTLRFEAKNGYFKSVSTNTKNHKNMCYSMAKRHQMFMYLFYKQEHLLNKSAPQGVHSKEIDIDILLPNVKVMVQNVTNKSQICQSKAVVVDGHRYESGEAVCIDFKDDEYVFSKIDSALFLNGLVYLLCLNMIVESFNSHLHAYKIIDTDRYHLVKVSELLDYHPLGIYTVSGKEYVSLKYFIPEFNSNSC